MLLNICRSELLGEMSTCFFEEEAEPGVYILIDGLIKLLKETHDARIVIVRLEKQILENRSGLKEVVKMIVAWLAGAFSPLLLHLLLRGKS